MTRTLSILLLTWAILCPVPALAEEPAIAIQQSIVFGKGGDVELKLDLARPPKGDGPFPLVVCIHGGAWQFGRPAAHHNTIRMLARHGYVAATVQYRLAPKYPFPAPVEDVKCAVRFLRANAKKYAIDPARVAALGDSAGGHLALLLGLMDAKDGLEGKGGHADQPSKVQAVVNIYGPTDLSTWAPEPQGDRLLKQGTGKDGDLLLADFVGTSDRKASVMKTASPVTYIDAKDAPVLTLHGTVDLLVKLEQAKALHAALKKAGVTEKLEVLEQAGHGWGGKLKEKTDRITVEFLDRHLKASK